MENLKLTREDIVKAAKQFFSDDLLDLLASLFPTWRLLAKGLPVSVGQIAKKLDRPIDEVTTNLRRVEEMGFLDYDARGQILSFFGLSLNPTRHRLRKGSLELYADCAVDSLFIPAFVGQVITVESESPLSGAMIRLTITPKAIKDMEPPNAVLSWVVPGISLPGGIWERQLYFGGPEEASSWLEVHEGLIILPVVDVHEGLRDVFIDPLLKRFEQLK